MQTQFLKLYDEQVDEIYAYCLEKTENKKAALILTKNIFAKAWDNVNAGYPLSQTHELVQDIALRSVKSYINGKIRVYQPLSSFKFS